MKMNIDIKGVTKVLNSITKTIDNLSYKEVIKVFKEYKIAYYSSLIPHFIRGGYIVQNENNLYQWVRKEPVYYKEIEKIIEEQRKKNYEKYATNVNEEDAIALLKKLGYRILKPKTEYVEL